MLFKYTVHLYNEIFNLLFFFSSVQSTGVHVTHRFFGIQLPVI